MWKRWRFVLLAAALLGVCFFDRLGALGLVTPDEPRYAAIARDMVRSGDWITPRLWGEPWFEKPPLYYWLAAISMRLLGASEASARLPSASLAALLWLATAWVTGRLFGGASGRLAFLLGVSSLGMIVFSHAASTDMPFTATFGLAMLCLSMWLFDPHRAGSRLWLLGFYAFLALSTLAKGPVGVVLAGGSFLLWVAVTRNWWVIRGVLHPPGLVIFLLISVPWYVVCTSIHGTSFLYDFFVYHNWIRYLEPVFKHPQPFWFFWLILPVAIFPWTLLVPLPLYRLYVLSRPAAQSVLQPHPPRRSPPCGPEPSGGGPDAVALRAAGRPGARAEPAWAFLASWVLFPLLFFSFSQSKLPGYILPCVPALVALIAVEINRLGDASPAARVGVISAGVALTGLVLATPRELSRLNLRVEQTDLIVAGLALVVATSAVAVFLFWRGWTPSSRTPAGPAIGGAGHRPQRLTRALVVLVLLIGGMVLYLNRQILPALDGSISARQLARSLKPHLPEAPLYVSAGLPRAWQYGLEYYLDRPLPRSLPSSPREGMRIRILGSRRELPLLPAGWEIVQVREVVPAQEIVLLEAEAIGPAPQSEAPEGRKP